MSIQELTPPRSRAPVNGARAKVVAAVPAGISRRSLNASERKLEQELLLHHAAADLEAVRNAWLFAIEAHGPQRRASGDPYVSHPLAVARILAELGLDPEAIQAALLHDIPEDTDFSLADIEERFGAGGRQARRRRHQAQQVRLAQPRGAAGREHPQDAAGDGAGPARRPDQARRPTAQHAHDRGPAAREAAAHRPPDRGDLRAAGRAPGHLADQVGARGPLVQGARPGRVPPARRAARDAAQGSRGVRSPRHGRAPRSSRRPGHQCRAIGPAEAHQQHLEKDAAQERQPVRDLRRPRDPRPGQRRPGLLRRARRGPFALAPDSRPVRRLHRDAQEQPLPEPPHGGRGAGRQAARGADPDPPDAPRLGGRHRRPLALQGRRQGRPRLRRRSSPGCAS